MCGRTMDRQQGRKFLRSGVAHSPESIEETPQNSGLGILKPFSLVLENDEKENIGELYLADDDTIIVSGDLMEGLDKELDDFFSELMKDK